LARLLEKSISKTLKAINEDIKKIEQQIKETINDDDQLRKLFTLITSVIGIGFVTATNLIIHTNEFKMFSNVRQLACYCGVVPFEYTSGKSVRGKPRVSHLANKKLKANLHMGALTAVKLDQDIKTYYERKVAEGKNKMSVLNAVRNKLLHRIFAVVTRGIPYEKNNYHNGLVLS
jgi:transposase